jgi:hypothetical protein
MKIETQSDEEALQTVFSPPLQNVGSWTHLCKCRPFEKLLLGKPVSEHPDWWNKAKTTTKPKVAAFTSFSVRLFAIPPQKKFNLEMAMHYLLWAVQLASIDS